MKTLLTACAFALAAAPALAADAVVYNEPAPVAAPIVAPGFDWTGPYIGVQGGWGWLGNDVDGDGWLAGIHAGYNYDLGTFVVGGELDYDFADLEVEGTPGEVDGVARAKVRGGVDLGRVMPYLTTGLAYATTDDVPGVESDWGYLVGGGIDAAVTDNIIVGGEYLYHNFNEFDDSTLDVDAHTLKAKVSFRF